MDVQRIILIGALCLISYMLVLQWNQDYGQPAEAQQATTSVSAYETQPVATDLPAADDSAQKGDLPATAVQAQKASLIDVKTDVLNVVIDTKGGDIIQVSLPEYKASLGSELPFVLLEQTSNRTYVSQSGLVGRNGPDASPAGRPTYAATQSEFDLDGQESISVDLTYTTEDSVQ
jgi:YidC/Oxa1 family membrane protein insertase